MADHLVIGILIGVAAGIAALVVISVVTLHRLDAARHGESVRLHRALADLQRTVRQELGTVRRDLEAAARFRERHAEALADRVVGLTDGAVAALRDHPLPALTDLAAAQERHVTALADELARMSEVLAADAAGHAQDLAAIRRDLEAAARLQEQHAQALTDRVAGLTDGAVAALRDHPLPALTDLAAAQERHLTALADELARMSEVLTADAAGHAKDLRNELLEALKVTLDEFRAAHAAQLEQVRVAVDERLESTLERRLGESFRVVSERLEIVSDRLDHVHRGLGEVQTFAAGLGHLQRAVATVRLGGGRTGSGKGDTGRARAPRHRPVGPPADPEVAPVEAPQTSAS